MKTVHYKHLSVGDIFTYNNRVGYLTKLNCWPKNSHMIWINKFEIKRCDVSSSQILIHINSGFYKHYKVKK